MTRDLPDNVPGSTRLGAEDVQLGGAAEDRAVPGVQAEQLHVAAGLRGEGQLRLGCALQQRAGRHRRTAGRLVSTTRTSSTRTWVSPSAIAILSVAVVPAASNSTRARW